MSVEQQPLLMLILASALAGITVIYIARRRKLNSMLSRSVLLTVFTINFVTLSLESDAMALLFLWFSAFLAVSLALDALPRLGVYVSEKLAVAAILATLSGLGLVVNLLVLSSSAGLGTKVFVLGAFAAVHVPLIIALAAYAKGKRELSKGVMQRLYFSRRPPRGTNCHSR